MVQGSDDESDDEPRLRKRVDTADSQELDEKAKLKKMLATRRAENLFGTLDKNEAPATAAGLPRGGRAKGPALGAVVAAGLSSLTEDDPDKPKGLQVLKAQKALQKLQNKAGAEKKMKAFRGLDINMIREELAGPGGVQGADDNEDAVSETKYGFIGEAASSIDDKSSKGGPLKRTEIALDTDDKDQRESQRSGSRKSGKSGGQSRRSSQVASSEASAGPTPRTRMRAAFQRFRKEFSICGIYLWGGEKSGRRLRDVLYPEQEYFWAYIVLLLPWGTAVLLMVTSFPAQIERYALVRVPAQTTVQLRAMNAEVVSQLRQAWDVASSLPSFARPINANDMLILFDLYPSLQAVSFGGVGMERKPREEFTSLGAQLTKAAPPGETLYTWQDVGYAWDVTRRSGGALMADLIVHLDQEGTDEIRVVLAMDNPLSVIEGYGDSFASLSVNGRDIQSTGERLETIYSEDFRLEAPYEGVVLSAQSGALLSETFMFAASVWYVFAALPALVLLLLVVRKSLISLFRGFKNRKECWISFMAPGGRPHATAYRLRALRGGKVYSLTGEVLSARDAYKERGLHSIEVRLKRTPREGSGSGRGRGEWNYPY